MLKKITALLMIAMCSLAAVSCSNGSKNTSAEDPGAVPQDSYEISWYYISPNTQTDISIIEEAANEYLKDKLNVTLKLTGLNWGAFATKISAIMASGEKYDIRYVSGDDYFSLARSGAFVDITNMVDVYAPKTKAFLGDNFIEGALVDGKLYGIQANKDKAHHYSLFYRQDIADKYGMDLSGVTSFRELYSYFETVRQNENDMYAFGIGLGGTPSLLTGLDTSGIWAIVPDGKGYKIVNRFATNEYMDTVKMSREMFEKGYVFKDAVTLDNKNELKSVGKLFSMLYQSKVGKLDEENAASPYSWKEIKLSSPVMNYSDTTGSVMAISQSSKNPERVLRFMELFNTDPYLNNLLNFGIEGKHYEKLSENRIKPIKQSGYDMVGMQWMFGNIFINYLTEKESENKIELLQKYNEEAKVSPFLSFMPDLSEVDVELAAVKNVVNEYQKRIEFGAENPEAIMPDFLNRMELAGSNVIIECVQEQFDEWLKDNKF